MSKQTAVEWLVEILLHKVQLTEIEKMYIDKAKEMEKEQIIEAYNNGSFNQIDDKYKPQQYYKETYGK